MQRLNGGLPLKANRVRQLLHAAHHVRGGRGHAGCPDEAFQRAGLQLEAMSVMCADTSLPRCCDGLSAPLSDLLAKINIPRSEILSSVVTLPVNQVVVAASCAHASRRAATFVEHMHAMPSQGQKMCARQASHTSADDGDRVVLGGLVEMVMEIKAGEQGRYCMGDPDESWRINAQGFERVARWRPNSHAAGIFRGPKSKRSCGFRLPPMPNSSWG